MPKQLQLSKHNQKSPLEPKPASSKPYKKQQITPEKV